MPHAATQSVAPDPVTSAQSGERLSAAARKLLDLMDCPISRADWRNLGPVPEEGRDTPALRRIVARLGLELHEFRALSMRIKRMATPFLVLGHNPDDIWVVRGRTGRNLVLVSPEDGSAHVMPPRKVSKMARSLIRLEADNEAGGRRGLGGIIAKHLKPVLWQVGLASVVINFLALASPLFMMTVYNKVVNHGALATLDVMAIGMVSLLLFELALRGLRGNIAARTGAKLDAALGSEVVHHLLALPQRVFESMPTGQIMERVRQIDQLRQFLAGQLPLLLVDLLFVGLFVGVIFGLNSTLGWITLSTLPMFVLISALAHRRQRELMRKSFVDGSAKASNLSEITGQSLTIKALGLEPEMERTYERRLITSAFSGYRASTLGNIVGSLGLTLQHATALVLIYVGARMIIANQMSIGALIACSILAARAIAPMRQVFAAWHQFEQARHAFKKLDSLMFEPAEHLVRGRSAEIEIGGRIHFDRVSYRYERSKAPVIEDLSFELESGTMLGVTGLPGSGKSTLLRLLIGLDKPTDGRIEIDGFDLSQLNLAAYRQQIGVVPQEVHLFQGTVADNIAIAAEDRSLPRIVAAAKFVGAHELIQRLPEGYDTELKERGGGLSLGQRQLISIARALIRNPRILILDEATSALDGGTESYLLENLKRAGRGRTIIMVSHKPSVLKACDRILLLDEGKLKQLGTPESCLHLLDRRPAEMNLQTVSAVR